MLHLGPLRSFWLCIVLVSGGSLFGQHLIDLSQEHINVSGFNAQVDSVIVVFNDTAAIGQVMNSVTSKKERAHFKGPIGQELDRFLRSQLHDISSSRHVVLKLNRLTIAEQAIKGTEAAFAGMNIEFLRRDEDGWVREYVHGTTAFAKSLDATHLHPANIAKALSECMQGYAYAMWTGTLTSLPLTERELRLPVTPEKLRLPVLTQGKPKDGVYATFMDMANNAPSPNIKFRTKDRGMFPQQRELKVKSDSVELIRSAWGICSGGRVFVNNGKRFVELQRDITGFHISHIEVPTEVSSGSALGLAVANSAAFMLFGGVGLGGVALVLEKRTPFPERLDLDMLTGQLVAVPRKSTNTLSGSTKSETLFLFEGKDEVMVHLVMFGGEEAVLKGGSHHWIRLVPRESVVPLEVRSSEGGYARLDLDTHESDRRVFLIRINSDSTLNVEPANSSLAKELLEKLRPEDEVK